MRTGRRATLATDVRPGQILALSLLANAPVFAGFVLGPMLTGGDPQAARAYAPFVVWLTGPLGLAAVVLYARTAPARREHRAARIGVLLGGVALALWALVLALTLRA